jgi:hypothetical protein
MLHTLIANIDGIVYRCLLDSQMSALLEALR